MTETQRKAMEQALDALNLVSDEGESKFPATIQGAISDLEAALAQQAEPEPEPEPITDYWYEHYIVKGLCGLCGNRGVIDTRGTTTPAGVAAGGLFFCICPNGQVMRKYKAALAEPEAVAGYRSCPTHCCPVHGCKYGHLGCPVHLGQVKPEYPHNNGCEYCESKPEQEPEPEPMAWMAEEWQQRVEQMRAEAMAYKEAYFRLVEMVAKSKAMEPGCPVFLATPPARRACWCATCDKAEHVLPTRMSLCPNCGDKRCPRADFHGNGCREEGGNDE